MSKTKVRKGAARRYSRLQTRKAWYEDLPLLPIIVGGILVLGVIALIVTIARSPSGSTADPTINGIPCQTSEQLAVHYHAHLSIVVGGNVTTLPSGVGVDQTTQCLYWLHSHAADGVIHIEAPRAAAARKFTLGDFFDIWGKPLTNTQVGAAVLTKDQKLVMFVDGKPYTGNPRNIVLAAQTQVVLEITPPQVFPPSYTFPAGL